MVFTPESNRLGSGDKISIIFSNGTIVDPGIDVFAAESFVGLYALTGFYIYLGPQDLPSVLTYITAAEVICALVPGAELIDGVLISAEIAIPPLCYVYESTMGGGQYIIYAEAVLYLGFVPMTEEVGFFTDQIGGTPINSGYYYYCPILPIPGSPRDDPWPAPYSPNGYYSVTLLLYDESTNTFVSGIPINLGGLWTQLSGSIVYLPEGFFQLSYAGACFALAGYEVISPYGQQYITDDPLYFYIDGPTTIIAYYTSIPVLGQVFYAIDWLQQPISTDVYATNVETNIQYTGVTDVSTGYLILYLPVGVYSISWDDSVYDYNSASEACFLYITNPPQQDNNGNYWLVDNYLITLQYY